MRHHWRRRAPRFALIALIFVVVAGFVVMGLWNWLMPTLFSVPRIGFWQALGLFILSKILFSGFRGGHWHRAHWRSRVLARWEQMTPEEREKLRAGLKGCWQD